MWRDIICRDITSFFFSGSEENIAEALSSLYAVDFSHICGKARVSEPLWECAHLRISRRAVRPECKFMILPVIRILRLCVPNVYFIQVLLISSDIVPRRQHEIEQDI